MELHTGGLPGNASPCRIPMSVDLSDLDTLLADFPVHGPVIDDRGFTACDIMVKRGCSHTRAQAIVFALFQQKKIKHVGYRSGRNGAKVYEVVK